MSNTAMKQWVDNWKRVGPLLEQIEAEELRKMDDREAMAKMKPLLDWCCQHAVPREMTGLVEQQRLFMIARKREEQAEK